MIQRPQRSVTRFFIPLIDVLILLFCIFLLMPYMNQPGNAGPTPAAAEPPDAAIESLRQQVAGLKFDLARARRESASLQAAQLNPSERVSVCILDIDPKSGQLLYYRNGKRLPIGDQRTAVDVVDAFRKASGPDKSPLFIIELPRVDNANVTVAQLRQYNHWFKGTPHRFDGAEGIPELEDAR